MAKHIPFSAPRRRSLPTINTKDVAGTLQNWKSKLGASVKNSLPAPTPYNFAVTNVRGGLKLSWAPVQTPSDKALGSPDGYEILKSPSGSFTDDLQVIPINDAGQSSYFDSTDGNAQSCHYRIRTTAGTPSNPQSVRGPESGAVSHMSIDSNDTNTNSTTVRDVFTTSKTRSNSRLGNYGIDSAFRTSLGTVGGSGQAAGAASGSGTSGGTPAPSSVTFDKIGGGTNNAAQMVVGGGASLIFDSADPGIIDSTNIQTIPVTTATPNDKDGLRFNATNGDLEYSPTPRTAGPTAHNFLTAYNETTGVFALAQPTEADLSTSDITTNNVSSTKHGFAPKSPADATKFLNGAATPAYAQVKDSDLSLSDITTNNVSISAHGFVPKLPNDVTKFLDGTGAFSVPGGGGGSGTVTSVGMTGDGVIFNSTVAGSPIATSGTLAPALLTQTAKTVLAGPASGSPAAPTFRQLGAGDLSNGTTGSGAVVLATSPALVTPNIGAATAGGALNMNSHLINSVTDPVNPQDAATKNYVDSTLIGGTNAVQIRGKSILNHVPVTGDGVYFHGTTWDFGMGEFPTRSYRYDGNGTSTGAVDHFGTSTAMASSGTGAANKASASEPPLLQISNAVASPNSNGIAEGGALGTNTGIFNRFRLRGKPITTGTNARYWIGLLGQVSLQVVGGTQYVHDIPTVPTIAFRWSQGTDTNWQAFVGTGAAQTVVDTGVAPDTTASHVFEFAFDGTSVYFYIDSALVATVSTNVPTASSTLGNSSFVGGIIFDNRNTTNTIGIQFATMRIIDQS